MEQFKDLIALDKKSVVTAVLGATLGTKPILVEFMKC